MAAKHKSDRTAIASLAVETSWAYTTDRTARTAPARAAADARFDAMVPAEVTDPTERSRRAEHFRKAHYQRMALRSAQSRRQKAS